MTDYFTMMRDVVGSYGDGVEDKRRWERQAVADQRAQTLYEQQQEQYRRQAAMQQQADAAYADMAALQQHGAMNYGGETGARALQAAEGDYAREYRRAGIDPGTAPRGVRPTTERDFSNAGMRIAIAKQDDAAIGRHRAALKDLDWNDAWAKHSAAWDSLDDATKAQQVKVASEAAHIPGSGTWVPSAGKKDGYLWYTPPGKDPIKLSNKDAKEFYILSNLTQMDPSRARTEMAKASDKVRTVYREVFTDMSDGVKANNQTLHNQETRAETARAHKASEARLKDKPNYIPLVNNKGEATYVDLNKLQTTGDGVLALPAGLRLPRSAPDPKAVEARAAQLLGKPIPGSFTAGKQNVYDEDSAYRAAYVMVHNAGMTTPNEGAPEVAAPPREDRTSKRATVGLTHGGIQSRAEGGALPQYVSGGQSSTAATAQAGIPALPQYLTGGQGGPSAHTDVMRGRGDALALEGNAIAQRYLQDKIDRGEQLTPLEGGQAKRLGLLGPIVAY